MARSIRGTGRIPSGKMKKLNKKVEKRIERHQRKNLDGFEPVSKRTIFYVHYW